MTNLLCHPLLPSVFLAALCTGLLFHFISLGLLLFSRDPFADLRPGATWFRGLLKILGDDVRYAACLTCLILVLLGGIHFFFHQSERHLLVYGVEWLVCLGVILLGSFFHFAYLKVLLIFRERIDFRFLQAAGGVRLNTLLLHVRWWEWALLLIPSLVLTLGFAWSQSGDSLLHTRNLLGFCGLICGATLIPLRGKIRQGYPKSLQGNPLFLFFRERSRMKPGSLSRDRPQASVDLVNHVRLDQPPFLDPSSSVAPAFFKNIGQIEKHWNVLQICLESVGAAYATTTDFSHEVPMPFLKDLAGKSLSLERHYSTSNCTVGSLFSLFTGLYPGENMYRWAGRQSRLPCWTRFLEEQDTGKRFQQPFLVHPGHTDYWFPRGPCLNSGWSIFDYHSIPETTPLPRLNKSNPLARPEENAVEFLLEKIRQAGPDRPFFGTYYSHLAHHPFDDYQPCKAVTIKPESVPACGREALQGYLNNLSFLDSMLEKIVWGLDACGKRDNTILLITADHGQGFGQHNDCLYHSGMPYEEIIRVPCLLHAPGLLDPQRVMTPSSHVDIAPTLLDLLGQHLEKRPLQGTSLFRERNRKYHFAVGWGGYHAALRKDLHKIAVDIPSDLSQFYDLTEDALERFPERESSDPEMLQDLLLFLDYQNRMLESYHKRLSGL